VNFGAIDMDFAGSVESWLDGHPADGADHPRLALLRDFTEGRLSAVRFHGRWLTADGPQERPSGAAPEATVEPVRKAADAEPKVSVEPPPKKVAVEPEPARPASGKTAAGDGAPETRRAVPGGPDASFVAANARAVTRKLPLWLRAGLVAGCYFGTAWLVYVAGGFGHPGFAIAGGVAGAIAWWLHSPSRWLWFIVSLLVVAATQAGFIAWVYFDGYVDEYLMSVADYPDDHVAISIYAVGGLVGAWGLLGSIRRVLRKRRSLDA
jgi:hypothetical protein